MRDSRFTQNYDNQNKVSWCFIENDHIFEWTEDSATVFLNLSDFNIANMRRHTTYLHKKITFYTTHISTSKMSKMRNWYQYISSLLFWHTIYKWFPVILVWKTKSVHKYDKVKSFLEVVCCFIILPNFSQIFWSRIS